MAFDFVNNSFVEEYKATTAMLMQQKKSLYRPLVTSDTYTGKSGTVVEQFGETEAQDKTSRATPTPNIDVEQKRPWVFPLTKHWATQSDKSDRIRMIIDPTSPLTQAGVAGMNRKMNSVIREAFFATAKLGENGTTDEVFDTANYQVGVNTGGTASSLNVAKLQEAGRAMLAANEEEIDEPLYCAISSFEHDSLLKEIEVISKDFNGGTPVLENGRVVRFMGFNFILDERLEVTGGNRRIPCWRQSGMHLGIWDDLMARVSERADLSYVWQVYLEQSYGATRVEQGKVVEIVCDDRIS